MYTDAPQEFLTTRGLLFKKDEEKKDHDMKIQDVKLIAEIEEKPWKSCCFSLHQESSLFFAKLAVSLLVIILCSYQLISLKDCNYQSLYSSLMSSVITFWLSKK